MKNKLKVLRLEKDLTQGELAEMVGISRTALAMIENDRATPDGDTIAALVKALKTPAGKLFPDFDCSLSYEYKTREEELKAAERLLSDMRFSMVLFYRDREHEEEFRKRIAAFDVAIKCIRVERLKKEK